MKTVSIFDAKNPSSVINCDSTFDLRLLNQENISHDSTKECVQTDGRSSESSATIVYCCSCAAKGKLSFTRGKAVFHK